MITNMKQNTAPSAPVPSAFLQKLKSIRKTISKCEEHLDGLICELDASGNSVPLGPVSAIQSQQTQPASSSAAAAGSGELAPSLPVISAGAVKTSQLNGGTLLVQLPGGRAVELTKTLAALFQILYQNAQPGSDSLGVWKPVAEIRSALSIKIHGGVSYSALKNLIHRLKKALAVPLYKPLIQNRRNVGYRLALRREADL